MITWMQKHKKYLIITIWISTIAFVGAGFVGWGQYKYGDKAGAVAKVGDVEVTMGELQKTYSNLYAQYNKMFQGAFDEEKAKSFGLKRQALQQLTQQALILNLAKSYSLEVTDAELLAEIKKQDYFFKNGVFSKEVYKQVLSRNNMSIKEYEEDVRKQLLIQKTLSLLPVKASKNEKNIINTILSIADKINYKVLDDSKIEVDTSDEKLKPYWEASKQNYKTQINYEIEYITQTRVENKYDDAKIKEYYLANKTHFKDVDGKLLPLEGAKASIISELDKKATKDAALRKYIAYKKGKLDAKEQKQTATISASNNPFSKELLEKISKLPKNRLYTKPVIVQDKYIIAKLVKTNPSRVKTFQEAKAEVLPLYTAEQKRTKLIELAKNSLTTFEGKTTDFITAEDAKKLTDLQVEEANEFLVSLFTSQKKSNFIPLRDGKIVLYKIVEQKLLSKTNTNKNNPIVKIKSALFNEGLIKTLQNKYKTEIFIKGL
jgi:peptidyl-prolyl cis-trans isomerase D